MRRYDAGLVTAQLVLVGVLVFLCFPFPPTSSLHGAVESAIVFPVLAALNLIAWLLTRPHPITDTQRASIVFGLVLGAALVANHLWNEPWAVLIAAGLWFCAILVDATTVITGIVAFFDRRRRAEWARERESNYGAN